VRRACLIGRASNEYLELVYWRAAEGGDFEKRFWDLLGDGEIGLLEQYEDRVSGLYEWDILMYLTGCASLHSSSPRLFLFPRDWGSDCVSGSVAFLLGNTSVLHPHTVNRSDVIYIVLSFSNSSC